MKTGGVGGCLTGFAERKSNATRPRRPPSPPLILLQATGQVSRHWLHLLHLGCLAFFSRPKWSRKFHVAGRVTKTGETGASKRAIKTRPRHQKACTAGSLLDCCRSGPPVVTFRFGPPNPLRAEKSLATVSLELRLPVRFFLMQLQASAGAFQICYHIKSSPKSLSGVAQS